VTLLDAFCSGSGTPNDTCHEVDTDVETINIHNLCRIATGDMQHEQSEEEVYDEFLHMLRKQIRSANHT